MEYQARITSLALLSTMLDGGETYQNFLEQSGLIEIEAEETEKIKKETEEEREEKAKQAIAKAEAIVAKMRGGR